MPFFQYSVAEHVFPVCHSAFSEEKILLPWRALDGICYGQDYSKPQSQQAKTKQHIT